MQSDLSLYHHVRIRDWWRGKVSSQEIYAYLIHLPEKSATKTAAREGDWSHEQYMTARIANEIMCYRADYATAHGGDMKPQLILSPKQIEAKRAERQQYLDLRQMMLAQMRGEFTPPTREVAFRTEDKLGHGTQPPPGA